MRRGGRESEQPYSGDDEDFDQGDGDQEVELSPRERDLDIHLGLLGRSMVEAHFNGLKPFQKICTALVNILAEVGLEFHECSTREFDRYKDADIKRMLMQDILYLIISDAGRQKVTLYALNGTGPVADFTVKSISNDPINEQGATVFDGSLDLIEYLTAALKMHFDLLNQQMIHMSKVGSEFTSQQAQKELKGLNLSTHPTTDLQKLRYDRNRTSQWGNPGISSSRKRRRRKPPSLIQ